MCEQIKKRNSFKDIDIERVSYIPYEPYLEIPSRMDYEYGVKRSIVLRNMRTRELEEITYRFSGAVTLNAQNDYWWYWGDVDSKDYHCCLVFYFSAGGGLKEVAILFCGDSLTTEEFRRISKGSRYPAEVTARFF